MQPSEEFGQNSFCKQRLLLAASVCFYTSDIFFCLVSFEQMKYNENVVGGVRI